MTAIILTEQESALWTLRARELLEEAVDAIETEDVLPTVGLAEACLRVACGEMDGDEIAEYWDEPECICPSDLLARGGHKGRCPTHG